MGSRPSSARAIAATCGPEIRTMPTPPRPGGVAAAMMVSALGSIGHRRHLGQG
jgi:hypothetical protein